MKVREWIGDYIKKEKKVERKKKTKNNERQIVRKINE